MQLKKDRNFRLQDSVIVSHPDHMEYLESGIITGIHQHNLDVRLESNTRFGRPISISKKYVSKRNEFKKTPWDLAKKQVLVRISSSVSPEQQLESGVNYFILALEKLGATTYFSCEGHPYGFYIIFKSSYALAVRIASCGYLTVEVDGQNRFRLQIGVEDRYSKWTQSMKEQLLRNVSLAWEKKLMKLDKLVIGESK